MQALTDPIAAFTDHMCDVGCAPEGAEIIADDKPHRYRVAGDKPKTMNGSYKLKVEPDGFSVGWCMSFKEGITHSWHIKTARKASAEDRAAWKAKATLAKIEREKQDAAAHAEAPKASGTGAIKRAQRDIWTAKDASRMAGG